MSLMQELPALGFTGGKKEVLNRLSLFCTGGFQIVRIMIVEIAKNAVRTLFFKAPRSWLHLHCLALLVYFKKYKFTILSRALRSPMYRMYKRIYNLREQLRIRRGYKA
jgi:hypothetical protein